MTGRVLFIFYVRLLLLPRFPFRKLSPAIFTLIKGLDIGQEAASYFLDLVLRDSRVIDKLFSSAQHGPPDSDAVYAERLIGCLDV